MCRHTEPTLSDLPAADSAARLARQLVRRGLCQQHAAHLSAVAELVTTELVTNAVRHGAAPITLTVDCVFGQGVVLAVTDAGPALPQAREAACDAEGGRGVLLLEVLSTRWGVVQDRSSSKKVWTVLDPERVAAI